MTPRELGLTGHAKNRRIGKCRDRPAFQDIILCFDVNGKKYDGCLEWNGWAGRVAGLAGVGDDLSTAPQG